MRVQIDVRSCGAVPPSDVPWQQLPTGWRLLEHVGRWDGLHRGLWLRPLGMGEW